MCVRSIRFHGISYICYIYNIGTGINSLFVFSPLSLVILNNFIQLLVSIRCLPRIQQRLSYMQLHREKRISHSDLQLVSIWLWWMCKVFFCSLYFTAIHFVIPDGIISTVSCFSKISNVAKLKRFIFFFSGDEMEKKRNHPWSWLCVYFFFFLFHHATLSTCIENIEVHCLQEYCAIHKNWMCLLVLLLILLRIMLKKRWREK